MFTYCKDGIVFDNTLVYDGYIYFPLFIRANDSNFTCFIDSSSNVLNFSIVITNNGVFDIFDSSYFQSDSVKNYYSINDSDYLYNSSLNFAPNLSNKSLIFDISISSSDLLDGDNNIYVLFALYFNFSNLDNFSSNIYPLLSNTGLSFFVEVKGLINE